MADDVLTRNENDELAVRVVSTSGDTSTNPNDVYTRDENGKLCVRVTGGGDQHNLGYFATQAALEEAYPTAEAGDWAIVGATDTVWIWDTDTSAWVDSDQKGQVTSVNNQTGAVTITADDILPTQTGYSGRVLGTDGFVSGWIEPEIVQRDTMPQADENEVGNIYQFVGTTDANYTNGYFYKCVSDGLNPATYSWTQVNVQPTPNELPDQTGKNGKYLQTNGTTVSWESVESLPSQTGNSGKFLTTDGTDASWSDKPLVNTSTTDYYHSLGILGNVYATLSVAVGYTSAAYKDNCTAVGAGANAYSNNMTTIGRSSGGYSETANYAICIGAEAQISGSAKSSIQIGKGTNSTAGTMCVGLSTDGNTWNNYELLSANGTIPKERLANVISTPSTMPTLAVADWSNNTQTVNVTGVTATNTVFVSPAPASAADYASAGIVCTAQGAGTLTFTCTTTPTNAITVNVVCL